MISIVLIEPKTPGNLGAVSRAMKNFGLKNLILINPKCSHKDIEAIKRAKHAQDILKKAKIKSFSYLKKFDMVIATTSKLGTDYNLPRSPIRPEQLADRLNPKQNIAIVFGREGIGLTNKEILSSDILMTIPTSKKYPAMNLSHSAAIIFYELFKKTGKDKIGTQITPISKKEKQQILKMIDQILNKMTFTTKEKKQTQKIVWKRVINKSFLTKREAFSIMGFLRKLL